MLEYFLLLRSIAGIFYIFTIKIFTGTFLLLKSVAKKFYYENICYTFIVI